MIVTDLHARGLQKELFQRVVQNEAVLQQRLLHFFKHKGMGGRGPMNRKKSRNYYQQLRAILQEQAISEGFVERRRALIWWFAFCCRQGEFNLWQEECLKAELAVLDLVPKELFTAELGAMTLGKHAIRRVYQRWGSKAQPIVSSPCILSELCEGVTNAVSLAPITLSALRQAEARLFIPTAHGAFLGAYCTDSAGRIQRNDMRTYISLAQMSPDQLDLWHRLYQPFQGKSQEAVIRMVNSLLLAAPCFCKEEGEQLYETICQYRWLLNRDVHGLYH